MHNQSIGINKSNIKNKSKIIVPKLENSEYVFHYTSVEALKSILDTKKLWFSGIQYLNDANEIKEGLIAIRDSFELYGDVEEFNKFKPFLNIIYNYFENKMLNSNIFVCSFSMGKDELPMWNYYTKNNIHQGYNICFSLCDLMESIVLKNCDLLDGCFISYGTIEYYDKNSVNEIVQLMEGMSNLLMQEYPLIAEKILMIIWIIFKLAFSLNDEQKQQYKSDVKSAIKNSSSGQGRLADIYMYDGKKLQFDRKGMEDPTLYIKNKAFKAEQEVRIVIRVPDTKMSKIQNAIKYRTCHGILVPYFEMDFSTSAIKGFNLSPTLKDDIVERGLRKYLDCCGFDINKMEYGIQKSQIPLRY